jgi:hypothetical protein
MTLSATNVLDNSSAPGIAAEIFVPDQLIAGPFQLVSHVVTVLTGQGVLKRGTVLGKQTVGAATSAAKSGGNTGNGTCTAVSSKGAAIAGVYQVRCVIAGTNSATFDLYNPNGDLIDQRQLSGSGATAVFANDNLAFTLADGATDFVVGDGFDITVAAPSGKYVKAVLTATDGSQVPQGVLADDVDATSADALAGLYLTGEFNANSLIYDASFTTIGALQSAMRPYGLFVKLVPGALSNADPT